MSSSTKQSVKRDTDIRGVVMVLLGALIVALLVVTNVQLANLDSPGSSNGSSVAAGEIPIAPPVQGTSNDVLSEELDQLSKDLAAPLDLLRGKLSPLAGLSAGQFAAADSFQDVASSVQRLGSVRHDLARMSAGLGDVVGNTDAMADSVGDSAVGLERVSREIGSMKRTMRRVDQSIKTTGRETSESMAGVSGGIEAMRQSISGMNDFLATMSTETKAMRSSMVELNANMNEFLELFCTLVTSESECGST